MKSYNFIEIGIWFPFSVTFGEDIECTDTKPSKMECIDCLMSDIRCIGQQWRISFNFLFDIRIKFCVFFIWILNVKLIRMSACFQRNQIYLFFFYSFVCLPNDLISVCAHCLVLDVHRSLKFKNPLFNNYFNKKKLVLSGSTCIFSFPL